MQSRGYGHNTRGNGGLLVGIQHYMYNIASLAQLARATNYILQEIKN